MKLLSLNCQRGYYHKELFEFLQSQIQTQLFDFLLAQELPIDIASLALEKNGYSLLRDTGKYKEVGIIYRAKFHLLFTEFIDFYGGPIQPSNTKSYGATIAVLKLEDSIIIVLSLHLPALLQTKTRKNAFILLIKKLQEICKQYPDALVIGGGDFNSIYSSEILERKKIIGDVAEFIPNHTPTYSGYRIEPSNLQNKTVWLVTRLGFDIELTLDHLFTNKISVINSLLVLPDLVSDHKPLLLEFDLPEKARLAMITG